MSKRKIAANWKNRIVGYGVVPASSFLANEGNWRIHPRNQQEGMKGALDTVGWVQDVIVNKRTSEEWGADRGVETLADGHLRVTLALREGDNTPVPVKYVDLTPAEEAQVLASLDPLAAMAATDKAKLDELMRQVQSDDERVQAMMAEIAEKEGLEYGKAEQPTGEEPPAIEHDRFEEVAKKWGTADGQLWILGEHKILCGDCLDPENINRLMGDELPALVIADPPYGVNIVAANVSVGGGEAYNIPFGGRKKGYVGGGNSIKDRTGHYPIESWKGKGLTGSVGASKPFGSKKDRAVRGSVGAAHVVEVGKYPVVIGDESTDTAEKAVALYCDLYGKAVQVWWGANYYSPVLPASQCWLVWYKETTGNFADCELAWTNQDKAAKLFQHRWNGMLRDSERQRRWHPTQKPAALAAWVCNEFTEPGAILLDPFGGGGWTVLGAEQSGRRARVIEMSHEYIAVILERWSQMTGQTPTLIGTQSDTRG